MPFEVTRLRRWFAIGAIAMITIVVGAYYYARWRVENALKQIPGKIGVEIQQSAQGFTVSKSEGGHTLFKVQAGKFVQYRQGGHAELHDVNITLYGHDSDRFDQIYGSEFEYDPQSGDISAKGEVQIDLEGNREGASRPDQAMPKELQNPIHLKTSGLVFNHKRGKAYTKEKIEFRIPQAQGSAIGANYDASTNVLTLESQVEVEFRGGSPAKLTAVRMRISKDPRLVILEHPEAQTATQRFTAQETQLFLRSDNTLDHAVSTGEVKLERVGQPAARVEAGQLTLQMAPRESRLQNAVFTGDVHWQSSGDDAVQGRASRVELNFAGKNVLSTVRTNGDVRLVQHQKQQSNADGQDVEVNASAISFFLGGGRHLERAETSGKAQITLRTKGDSPEETLVTAGRFTVKCDRRGRLASMQGGPDARITITSPGQPARTSSSNQIAATFHPGSGIEAIVQQGNVVYTDGDRKAWAGEARYTPADRMLRLSGSPRVVEGGITIAASNIRLNRGTGDAVADGEVKTTYSDLTEQPDGAMLAASDPIHVTATTMTAHRAPAIAVYSGGARLWQGANVIVAPTIEFDRDHRSVVARGAGGQAVSTVLVQADKAGQLTPVTITSARLSYIDNERQLHFTGGVTVKGADLTITARQMDISLQARTQGKDNQSLAGNGKLERMVAKGDVVIVQPQRKATGDQLTYMSAEDKLVLTGGPPSIFDAEHGKITGVSLTYFRHDDRVLVEGNNSSPAVTQTRVAH